ncbi:DUF2125 domain-containing protein [Primorskyibacter sp. S87]|uniref:DUF2125 domain-containing protein n=1 Tax=Primorskyibacter sp. S87 TaxID=3415126 RepID=UPI003C7AD32E
MRLLVKVLIAAGLLWSLYWYAAGYGLRTSVTGWFAQQETRGWQAEFSEISTSGYPFRHVTALTSPALADPRNGTAWQADWLMLESPAIWPGRQTLRFPDTSQRLSYFDQTAVIAAENLQAVLFLHPGLALALDKMAVSSGAWTIQTGDGDLLGAEDLTLAMEQVGTPETYRIDLSAAGFTPGDGLRRLSGSSASLPPSFETLQLRTTVTFDRSWDRSALEESRPQPRRIDLDLAEMKWGALSLFVAGELDVDEQGIPTGELAFKAENWREMLTMAENAGALPPQATAPVSRVLNMLAGLGGNPNSLDVQLNFRDGFVAFGPIPLGPAPRLVIR